jgi:hypothetical protein
MSENEEKNWDVGYVISVPGDRMHWEGANLTKHEALEFVNDRNIAAVRAKTYPRWIAERRD